MQFCYSHITDHSGVSGKTVYDLRQATTERLKPVVFLSGMGKALLESQERQEELYQALKRTVESINDVIGTYSERDGPMGELMVRV